MHNWLASGCVGRRGKAVAAVNRALLPHHAQRQGPPLAALAWLAVPRAGPDQDSKARPVPVWPHTVSAPQLTRAAALQPCCRAVSARFRRRRGLAWQV